MKHPEEHKKEIHLRKGIVLVLGGLNQYLEYCQHLVCWDGEHPKKEIMASTLNSTRRRYVGIVLVLGGLNQYLEY